ncbi:MAG: hypothetical protein ACRC2O_12000 [Chitinophagaceae bacterium]
MKKIIPALTIIILALSLNSCTKDSTTDPSNTTPPTGQWRIHYYWDEKDETADFSGYIFEFKPGGVLQASKGLVFVTGTWSETSTKFIIDFGTTPVLSEINDDWLKTDKTATLITLKDDNPAQDDELHFIKL